MINALKKSLEALDYEKPSTISKNTGSSAAITTAIVSDPHAVL